MLSVRGRAPTRLIVEPIAAALLWVGISPNTATLVGTVISVLFAVILIPTNHLFAAVVSIATFAAFDLLDGTMTRFQGQGAKYGATLDASCDRITDAALLGAVAHWVVYHHDAGSVLLILILIITGSSQIISYVKARAEVSGLRVNGGLVERAGRLTIGLIGVGLQGLGVGYALHVAMWLLAIESVFTVVQRLYMVVKQPGTLDPIAPPEGAADSSPINPDSTTKPTGSADSNS